MLRFASIAFLIAHGAIHLAIWAPPPNPEAPFDVNRSWMLGSQRNLALGLALIAGATLMAAGIGLWVEAGWWRPVAVAGLAGSLVLMTVFFHPWFLPIQLVNTGLLASLIWLDWPTSALVGA